MSNKEITVTSYNVNVNQHIDESSDWYLRREHVIGHLIKKSSDVVCLQELSPEQAFEIFTELKKHDSNYMMISLLPNFNSSLETGFNSGKIAINDKVIDWIGDTEKYLMSIIVKGFIFDYGQFHINFDCQVLYCAVFIGNKSIYVFNHPRYPYVICHPRGSYLNDDDYDNGVKYAELEYDKIAKIIRPWKGDNYDYVICCSANPGLANSIEFANPGLANPIGFATITKGTYSQLDAEVFSGNKNSTRTGQHDDFYQSCLLDTVYGSLKPTSASHDEISFGSEEYKSASDHKSVTVTYKV
jgi:hypothetical protein